MSNYVFISFFVFVFVLNTKPRKDPGGHSTKYQFRDALPQNLTP